MGGDKFEGKITTNPLTNDGLHFTDSGYQKLARHFSHGLGYPVEDLEFSDSFQNLRKSIIEKNRLFFHRWRLQMKLICFSSVSMNKETTPKKFPNSIQLLRNRKQ